MEIIKPKNWNDIPSCYNSLSVQHSTNKSEANTTKKQKKKLKTMEQWNKKSFFCAAPHIVNSQQKWRTFSLLQLQQDPGLPLVPVNIKTKVINIETSPKI